MVTAVSASPAVLEAGLSSPCPAPAPAAPSPASNRLPSGQPEAGNPLALAVVVAVLALLFAYFLQRKPPRGVPPPEPSELRPIDSPNQLHHDVALWKRRIKDLLWDRP